MPNKILKILKEAQEEKWAVGQFNVSTLEALRGAVQAALNLKSPLIIGTSEGESNFIGLRQAVALVASFREETRLPIFLNLDHGKTFEYIKEAIEAGYEMVHFDGAQLPLEKNIEITKKIMDLAQEKGVSVEGEVGLIPGASRVLEKAPEIKESDLTDPKEAGIFVKETKVDRLAVNIGTFHGMESGGLNPRINLQRLREIKEEAGDKVFLVLHGGSGTPEEDLRQAIKTGIVKININTELRTAFTEALKKSLKQDPKETTPYKYLPPVLEAVQRVVENKMRLFGSVNKI
ncbi:MAG: class II fructose-bisphosphate aldolase [Candidatus Nealsonbacteria bacterium]|nr:class II fructose-bisphosphate aldolase [Candidatus Nealsonbacteria bacterium]